MKTKLHYKTKLINSSFHPAQVAKIEHDVSNLQLGLILFCGATFVHIYIYENQLPPPSRQRISSV